MWQLLETVCRGVLGVTGPTGTPSETLNVHRVHHPVTPRPTTEANVEVPPAPTPQDVHHDLKDKLRIEGAQAILSSKEKEFLQQFEGRINVSEYRPSRDEIRSLKEIVQKVKNHLKGEVDTCTKRFTICGTGFGDKPFARLIEDKRALENQLNGSENLNESQREHLQNKLDRINDRLTEEVQGVPNVVKYQEFTSSRERREAVDSALFESCKRNDVLRQKTATVGTSSRVLAELAREWAGDDEMRNALLGNPWTPAKGLEALLEASNGEVTKRAVAGHTKASAELLGKLANDPDVQVRLAVARHANASAELLGRLANDPDEQVRLAVISNASTGTDTLRALATSSTDTTELRLLATNHADPEVLKAVASNPATPLDVLAILARNTQGQEIQDEAVRNLNQPGRDPERLASVARSNLIGPDMLALLARHNDVNVVQVVVNNPNTPKAVLETLANDPHAPKVVLETLLNGAHAPAAKAAFITMLKGKEHPQSVDLLKNVDTIAAQGRLTRPVMEQLLALADPTQTPLHPGIDKAPPVSPNRQEIVFHAIKDLAQPTAINQGKWGTCAATRVQTALALRNPARYVELLRHLCHPAPDDATRLVPGLRRPDDQNLNKLDELKSPSGGVTGEGSRTITARLMSPAMMNLASFGHYQTLLDRHVYSGGDQSSGLDIDQSKRLIEGVLGIKVQSFTVGTDLDAVSAYAKVEAEAKHGPVQVDLRWGTGAHAVMFVGTGVIDGTPMALLINPWGERNTMPLEEFQARLMNVHLPKTTDDRLPVPPKLDLSEYKVLEAKKYKTSLEVLQEMPEYKSLESDDKVFLDDFVTKNLSPASTVLFVPHIIVGGKFVDDDLMTRLEDIADRHADDPKKQAHLGEHILNAISLSRDDNFKRLPNLTRWSILQLLAKKDVPNSPELITTIGSLAAKGRMTYDFLDELDNKANAAEVVAAMNSENQHA